MPRLDSPSDLYTQIKLGIIKVTQRSRPECRFWKNVNKNGPVHPVHGQCWMWTGCTCLRGYGKFNGGYKPTKAHRWSYEEFVGHVPNELHVLHHCDNPTCVRPEHLFLGTHPENMRDMVNKDRQTKGEEINSSKLTNDGVKDIRRRYRRGSSDNNSYTLAEEKGVSPATIQYIVSGKAWKHVS